MRDVVVIGSGPNGLTAAARLARAGRSVLVLEARSSPGGGARTETLTLPGFSHDVCSTVHPLGVASPVFRHLELERHGVEWVHSPAPLVHLLDEDHSVFLERSVLETARSLGDDGRAYADLLGTFAERFDEIVRMFLGPLRVPESPALFTSFALRALRSMNGLARSFGHAAAPALLGGIAAHAMLPLDAPATASFGLVLAAAGHAVGWPVAKGGSGSITSALVALLHEAGGEIECDRRVRTLDDLPPARAYVFDLTPKQFVAIAGNALPRSYRNRLDRYRYGTGVFKIDWALEGPVPWRDPNCLRAATVHVGGTLAEVAEAEAAVHRGEVPREPFVLFVQPTVADPTRAPDGRHVGWAYCHVPARFRGDLTDRIEARIERFAPGFRKRILGRHVVDAVDVERENPNYVGGDINGGIASLDQLFFRPVARLDPYSTPTPNLFLCSSATPPGGGVHGLCGEGAAQSVLGRMLPRPWP